MLLERLRLTAPPVDEVRAFLERGVDPNFMGILGTAVQYDTPEVVELLLQYGGDANQEGEGSTLLHEVVSLNVWSASELYAPVAVLLAYGADVNAKDDNGETALDIAQRRKLRELEALLRNPSDATRILEERKARYGQY